MHNFQSYFKNEEERKEALRVHGLVFSSDGDSSSEDTDDSYDRLKPINNLGDRKIVNIYGDYQSDSSSNSYNKNTIKYNKEQSDGFTVVKRNTKVSALSSKNDLQKIKMVQGKNNINWDYLKQKSELKNKVTLNKHLNRTEAPKPKTNDQNLNSFLYALESIKSKETLNKNISSTGTIPKQKTNKQNFNNWLPTEQSIVNISKDLNTETNLTKKEVKNKHINIKDKFKTGNVINENISKKHIKKEEKNKNVIEKDNTKAGDEININNSKISIILNDKNANFTQNVNKKHNVKIENNIKVGNEQNENKKAEKKTKKQKNTNASTIKLEQNSHISNLSANKIVKTQNMKTGNNSKTYPNAKEVNKYDYSTSKTKPKVCEANTTKINKEENMKLNINAKNLEVSLSLSSNISGSTTRQRKRKKHKDRVQEVIAEIDQVAVDNEIYELQQRRQRMNSFDDSIYLYNINYSRSIQVREVYPIIHTFQNSYDCCQYCYLCNDPMEYYYNSDEIYTYNPPIRPYYYQPNSSPGIFRRLYTCIFKITKYAVIMGIFFKMYKYFNKR